MQSLSRKVVLVSGLRTPFLRVEGKFKKLKAYQLGKLAIRGLLEQNLIPPNVIDLVIMGNAHPNLECPNLARISAQAAGLDLSTPAKTINANSVSSLLAIAEGFDQIRLGKADVVIAGGAEGLSNKPLVFPKSMQQKLAAGPNVKKSSDYLKLISQLRPSDFIPDSSIYLDVDYGSNKLLGQHAEFLAGKLKISRRDQDLFAVRSHQLASKALQDGFLGSEIYPVSLAPKFKTISEDSSIYSEASLDQAERIKPLYDAVSGKVTVTNSAQPADGASAVLLMSEIKALELGLQPIAYLKDYQLSSGNSVEDILLGPAFAIPQLLDNCNLSLTDIGCIEIHEAFAGQVLANFLCLESHLFASEKLNKTSSLGSVDMTKVNLCGGSIAFGNPHAASGARLVSTAANRLVREQNHLALVGSTSSDGQGFALVLERYGS